MGDIGTVQARYEVLGETETFERVEEPDLPGGRRGDEAVSETPPGRAASEAER